MIRHYIKIAFRNIFKHKTQSIISILGLMAGIFCFSLCTYFAREVNRLDSGFPEYNRMAKLFVPKSDSKQIGMYKKREAFTEDIKEFLEYPFDEIEYIAAHSGETMLTLEFDTDFSEKSAFRARSLYINSDFLQVYPTTFLEGSTQAFFDNPDGVIVSSSFARRISPDESVLGRSFLIRYASKYPLEQTKRYTIVGVAKDYPNYTSFGVLAPQVLLKDENIQNHATFLLRKGANTSHMNERLDHIRPHSEEEDPENNAKIHFITEMKVPFLPMVILSFIAFLVLLVGIINFMSFTVGAFLNRNRELSLRRTLGGSFRHLSVLLFTELCMIIGSAILLSMALCESLVPYLHSLIPNISGIQEAFNVNTRFLLTHQLQYGSLLLLGCGIISVMVAWRISKSHSLAATSRGSKTGSRHRLRNIMLGIQFFISILFMYATGVTIQKFMLVYERYEQNEANRNHSSISTTLSLNEDYMLQEHAVEIIDALRSKEWCEYISYYTREWNMYQTDGRKFSLFIYFVAPDYFAGNNIQIPNGDALNEDYFCFINHTLQTALAEDSIYTSLSINGVTYPITGIVDYEENKYNIMPVAFTSRKNEKPNYIMLTIRENADTQKVKNDIYAIITPYLPEGAIYFFSLPGEKIPSAWLLPLNIMFAAILSGAVICILITVLGLYGAITLDTNRRQKEVAIRKINGAKGCTIFWLFGKLYLILYMCAATAATWVVYAIFLFLGDESDYFDVYRNPVFYIIVLLTAATIILITILYRLQRIARLNPAACIKTE